MSEQWQYQLRVYLTDELADVARSDRNNRALGTAHTLPPHARQWGRRALTQGVSRVVLPFARYADRIQARGALMRRDAD